MRTYLFIITSLIIILSSIANASTSGILNRNSLINGDDNSERLDKNIQEVRKNNKIILYPKFIILHAADFPAFKQYLSENKEEYRDRRSAGLVEVSKGNTLQKSSVVTNGVSRDDSVSTTGVNPDVIYAMLNAYRQFDRDYDINKRNSRIGVDVELEGQLQSSLTEMMERNLISDQDSPIAFTYGDLTVKEMKGRLGQDQYSDKVAADDILRNTTHFIYGYWSEYYDEAQPTVRMVKVTVFLEKAGGYVKSFSDIGSVQGDAMQKVATKIMNYAFAQDNYTKVTNPFPKMDIKTPLSIDDQKTPAEAMLFCKTQSTEQEEYRLPYAYELLNMPGKYRSGGAHFIDLEHQTYAIADKRGGIAALKLLPSSNPNDNNRIATAMVNEKLSYVCVRNDTEQAVENMELLYSNMFEAFNLLKEENNGHITKELCKDPHDENDIETIKDMAVKVVTSDSSPQLPSSLKQCVLAYLKDRHMLYKEYKLLNKL